MLQVGLCDDEPVLLDTLEEKVRRCFSENLIFAEIQAFTGGQNLLYEAEDGKRFDLLLLDIEMPGMDGLKLASRLRLLLPDALLIFITSHVEFALDAYELSTFRYIPKNNMDGRLEHALLDAAAAIQLQQSQSYIISNQNRLERIPLKNLLYIQHVEKNSLLVTGSASPGNTGKSGGAEHTEFKVRKTLQEIYEELNPDDFLFIDRGFIVNLSHVMSVKAGCCILRDGTRLPVSQARMPVLKEHRSASGNSTFNARIHRHSIRTAEKNENEKNGTAEGSGGKNRLLHRQYEILKKNYAANAQLFHDMNHHLQVIYHLAGKRGKRKNPGLYRPCGAARYRSCPAASGPAWILWTLLLTRKNSWPRKKDIQWISTPSFLIIQESLPTISAPSSPICWTTVWKPWTRNADSAGNSLRRAQFSSP